MTLGLKIPRFMVFAWLISTCLFLLFMTWMGFSYLKMLVYQEGNLRPFVPAVLELLKNSEQIVELQDSSQRFLARNYETLERILAKQGWVLHEQMGASMNFRLNDKELVVGCRQYTAHFIVCSKI